MGLDGPAAIPERRPAANPRRRRAARAAEAETGGLLSVEAPRGQGVSARRGQVLRDVVDARAGTGATSCNEYIYSPDELEFLKAMMDHKARTGKQFPTLTEIFHVLLSLGYRKP
jgi:hypothetical protein